MKFDGKCVISRECLCYAGDKIVCLVSLRKTLEIFEKLWKKIECLQIFGKLSLRSENFKPVEDCDEKKILWSFIITYYSEKGDNTWQISNFNREDFG